MPFVRILFLLLLRAPDEGAFRRECKAIDEALLLDLQGGVHLGVGFEGPVLRPAPVSVPAAVLRRRVRKLGCRGRLRDHLALLALALTLVLVLCLERSHRRRSPLYVSWLKSSWLPPLTLE